MALSKFSQASLALIALASSGTVVANELYAERDKLTQELADQDNDGVVNVRDFCPDTIPNALVDNDGCAEETVVVQSITLEILFDVNSANVKPQYYPEVKKVADFLQDHPETEVVIEGHTDNTGSRTLNENLSSARAGSAAHPLGWLRVPIA